MKLILRVVVAVLALLVFTAPDAVARHGQDGRHPSVVPADRVGRDPGSRLLGDWFVENLSRPADASPFGGTADLCLDLGRRDRVLSPAGGVADDTGRIEMSCRVELGRPVVLVMTSADCSTAEAPPFFATTAREQRACAVSGVRSLEIRSIEVGVDGRRPVYIHRDRFFEVSKQRRVVFPENAVFDARPGPATFVAAAWMAEIRGLGRGHHPVEATTTADSAEGPLVFPFVVHLEVVGRHHHHHRHG